MTDQTLSAESRAILNAAFRIGVALGRKFEATDLTVELRRAARHYAAVYSGDFPFMLDMRDRLMSGTGAFSTDAQTKSILNCLMADAKRRLADRKPAGLQQVSAPAAANPQTHVTLAIVPDGRYRVTLADGSDIALKIALAGQDSKLEGSRVVSTRINGDEWMGVAHIARQGDLRLWRSCSGALRDRVRDAINVLDAATDQDGWLVAGLAFARQGSECFICGRDLDTPESLTAGYGPVCAEKNGLPWGLKASPPSAASPSIRATVEEIRPCAAHLDCGNLAVPVSQISFRGFCPACEATASTPVTYAPTKEETEAEENARYWATAERAKLEGRSRTYDELFGRDSA